MLRTTDWTIKAIAAPDALPAVITKVIEYAEGQDKVADLIKAAQKQKPTNVKLSALDATQLEVDPTSEEVVTAGAGAQEFKDKLMEALGNLDTPGLQLVAAKEFSTLLDNASEEEADTLLLALLGNLKTDRPDNVLEELTPVLAAVLRRTRVEGAGGADEPLDLARARLRRIDLSASTSTRPTSRSLTSATPTSRTSISGARAATRSTSRRRDCHARTSRKPGGTRRSRRGRASTTAGWSPCSSRTRISRRRSSSNRACRGHTSTWPTSPALARGGEPGRRLLPRRDHRRGGSRVDRTGGRLVAGDLRPGSTRARQEACLRGLREEGYVTQPPGQVDRGGRRATMPGPRTSVRPANPNGRVT